MKPLSVFGRRSRRDLIARRTSSQAIGLEQLESRVNLSAATLIPTVQSVSGEGNDSQWLSPAAAPASQQIAALTTSSAAAVAGFTAKNRVWTSAVDVVVPSLPDATSLRLQVTDGLTYWNGRQAPSFRPARANVRIDVSLGGQTAAVRAGQPQPNDTLALAASSTNRVAARIAVAGQPARAAAAGWYAVSAKVVAPNGGAATPVTFLFSIGRVPVGSRAAAIRAVGGVGAKPAQVSVGVTLTPPPVVAQPPVVAPITMPPVPILPTLSASRTAPQLPAVQSTPPYVLPPAVNGIVELSGDITSNTTFSAGTVYVITGEVHVRSGVTLSIEDGVEVRIRNGNKNFATLTSRALIFDSGSSLVAENVIFQAANDANEPVQEADNGGVFFCGGTRNATKDDVSSQRVGPEPRWSFQATSIVANFLGRKDPLGGDGNGNARDDIDAVSVIGVVSAEWNVKAVEINHSGDDGFDLTDSNIEMESVKVIDPVEDGVNLTSSDLGITKLLEVDMTDSTAPDREIFDFEGPGPCTLTVSRQARVDIRGYWDNSIFDTPIYLASDDMKPPDQTARKLYEWKGPLEKSAAIIYST
jgi:hypothetical protein